MKQENSRQNELLAKYYDLDENSKLINVFLHYEKASDILDINVGNPNYPKFQDEVLDKINSIIENSKPGYKVQINFEIEDYEDYTPRNIIDSFNDTLEMKQYSSRRKRQFKELTASILVLIGTLLLLLMAVINKENFITNETNAEIFSEIVDIVAWVFIWEAASMLFLEHSEQAKFALIIRKKVSKIGLYQKNNQIPLAVENSSQIFKKWENEGRIKRLGKYCTLISSFAFIFLAFYSIYSTYLILKANPDITSIIVYSLVLIFSFTIPLLAGLGGIAMFLGRNSKIRKVVGVYAYFLTIMIIIGIVSSILNNDLATIISSIFSLIIDIFYVLGYVVEKYVK